MNDTLSAYTVARFTPSEDQKNLLAALDAFFASDERCFLLKGYAGTGKTTITKYIIAYLKSQDKRVVLLAPTGRAARILSLKTGETATTIHKGIYNLNEVDEIEVGKEEKTEHKKFKFRYNLNSAQQVSPVYYLVDEASMISDKYSEGDFFVFGSGKLLTDLMKFMSLNSDDRNDKVIFIGDSAQLPPVTDAVSRALDAEHLSKDFGVAAKSYELTQVVRQAENSGILENATYLRNQLKLKARNSFELKLNFPDVQNLSADEVVDTFFSKNPSLELDETVIINYSNKAALEYNLLIREKYFPDKWQLAVDDILLISQNNYNYQIDLLNGMMIKVVALSPVPEQRTGMQSYDLDGTRVSITHKFRNVTFAITDDKGVEKVLSCLILENFLYSDAPQLTYAENVALYLDFKKRHPNLKPKSKEFGDALRKDPWFNALRLKYGYAITCHKAQGGEWKNAIVNLDVSQGKLSANFLRWTYTAITRASKKLYLFNVPKQNQFTLMEYKKALLGTVVDTSTTAEIEFTLPSNFDTLKLEFGLSNAAAFLQDKFLEILAVASKEGVTVSSRTPNQYCERYFFEKEESKVSLDFMYKGNGNFTVITVQKKVTTDQALAEVLRTRFLSPYNIEIIQEGKSKQEEAIEDEEEKLLKLFQDGRSDQQILYKELSEILKAKSIIVDAIIPKTYQELYYLKRNKQKAAIIFWYDGLCRFTKVIPHLPECNSNELLQDIEECVDDLKKL